MTVTCEKNINPSFMDDTPITPFESAEEAWFWFITSWQARQEGAKITAGQGDIVRPCEPVDIFKIVERLYRGRRLQIDHLRVMNHYGKRQMKPDLYRPNEARSYTIWEEGMMRLESALESKGIVVVHKELPFCGEYPVHMDDVLFPAYGRML